MLCLLLCLFLFVGLVGEPPVEFDTQLYNGLWRSPLDVLGPLLVPVPGIGLWPWQIMLFALAPLGLRGFGARGRRSSVLDAAILVSLASVAAGVAWGLLNGGALHQAYYQLWRFLAALLVAIVLVPAIRTSRDLRLLCLTIIAAALVRSVLCIWFYWVEVHGKIVPTPPHMTTHDDSLLFAASLLLMASWGVVRGRFLSWMPAVLAGPVVLYAMVLNNRRLVWIELALACAVIYVLLPRGALRRRVNVVLPILAPLLLAYVLIGAGREGPVFAPARALTSAGSNENASSLARQEEIRNLLHTLILKGNPLFGTGWGVPYEKRTSVYANFESKWELFLYTPHNSLLGVAVFSGLAGICGLWGVVPVAALLATRGYRAGTGPVARAAALGAVSILPAYSVQCFGDIGLQSLTCGLILGMVMAVAGRVGAWADSPPEARRGVASRGREVHAAGVAGEGPMARRASA